MALSPASSRGTDLAAGGTVTGPLLVKSDTTPQYAVLAADDTVLFRIRATATGTSLETFTSAGVALSAVNLQAAGIAFYNDPDGNSGPALRLFDAGLTLYDESFNEVLSAAADVLSLAAAKNVLDAGGPCLLTGLSAPADGFFNNGQVSLWFDSTAGVGNTKLMAKCKDAAGVVKTATVAVLA